MSKTIHRIIIGGLLTTTSLPSPAESIIDVPFRHAKGQALFELKCSNCHGDTLVGSDKGPPLIHAYYKPSHHDDGSFYRAGLKGVKAHHWKFGDMPPVKGMTEKKMRSIIGYIRVVQQAKNLY